MDGLNLPVKKLPHPTKLTKMPAILSPKSSDLREVGGVVASRPSAPNRLPNGYIASMATIDTHPKRTRATTRIVTLTALLVIVFWIVLRILGREVLSDSDFGVWTGAWTPNTSQWMLDPYTFSHLLHGIFLYWLLLSTRRWLSLGSRFLIASLIEAAWEILENSPIVIDRYRTATASLDYYGDSILNSTFDLLAAMAGFWLAWKCNWKWVLALVIAIELLCAYFVHDNLTLNILMLFYPSEAIKAWQLGQ
jgi:hypothetical protein